MIAGIGIDMVDVNEFARLTGSDSEPTPFLRKTFSTAELKSAESHPHPNEHLAGCFAAKEATFKAVAESYPDRTFDLRIVEVLEQRSGAPYISHQGKFAAVLDAAHISHVHVSITNESGFAIAYVVAERE